MVQSTNPLTITEGLIEFFDKVLNRDEFPAGAASKVDHAALVIAIECYGASVKHNSNMDIEKLFSLEPGLVQRVKLLMASGGEQLVKDVITASNCFFEKKFTAEQQEKPSNSASKALADPFETKTQSR